MPYTFEDFQRDYVLEHIHKLPLEDRLKGLTADDRLKGLTADDRLKGLSPEELLNRYMKETGHKLPPETKAILEAILSSAK